MRIAAAVITGAMTPGFLATGLAMVADRNKLERVVGVALFVGGIGLAKATACLS